MYKKGQSTGVGMAIVAAFIVLAVIGIIQIISIAITSNVGTSIETNIPLDDLTTVNESVTISVETAVTGDDNSTLLAQDGYVEDSEIVINTTNGYLLTRDGDYMIVLVGTSGATDTRANFTLINVTNSTGSGDYGGGFNATALSVTYVTKERTEYHLAKDNLVSNNLSAFELGGTAQIVFAATVILLSVFGLLATMRMGK